MKDYRTWWRKGLDTWGHLDDSVLWPIFEKGIPNDDTCDCIMEQIWAEDQGLSD